MKRPLTNYIRTYRKRLGLSQDELAFLLGLSHGATVSRYEGKRLPDLRTALAASVVFSVPVEELFAGEAYGVEVLVRRRAQVLIEELGATPPERGRERKVDLLSAISERPHRHAASARH